MFAYCGNNPVMFIDPKGTVACSYILFGGQYSEEKTKLNNTSNQLIRFDFDAHPEFNVINATEYVDEMQKNELPDNRTYNGIWLELVTHYIVHKIDVFDVIDNDDVADMGNFENDPNAEIWESAVNVLQHWKEKIKEKLGFYD